MTKKKKGEINSKEYKNNGDVIDNKDINSQNKTYQEEKKSDSGVGSETSNEVVEISDQVIEPEKSTDKEVSKEASAEEKLADMQDRYLRLCAEFDNYRKRTLREKIELTKHSGENILLNIIPVMDDFERALKLMETATDCEAVKSGIDLIYYKFREFLERNGIREIDSLNRDFNVDLHEAVNKIPVQDENMKGKVVEVLEKGYYLNDKVMRFSKVVVGQ
jgi:molecular chaperone GrpE